MDVRQGVDEWKLEGHLDRINRILSGFVGFFSLWSLVCREDSLAQPYRLRSDLYELVIRDELKRLFE